MTKKKNAQRSATSHKGKKAKVRSTPQRAKRRVNLFDLRAALRAAATRFLGAHRKQLEKERLYGFVFEISAEGFDAHGAINTEESLARYATTYDDPKLAARAFRWGCTEDGGWLQRPDSPFNDVNSLLRRAGREQLYEEYGDTLEQLCVEVLRDLDASGTFGTGAARERVGLGVCFIGGSPPDEFLPVAKQVNPPTVFQRLEREVHQADRAQMKL
jgi:hypothetical protein